MSPRAEYLVPEEEMCRAELKILQIELFDERLSVGHTLENHLYETDTGTKESFQSLFQFFVP